MLTAAIRETPVNTSLPGRLRRCARLLDQETRPSRHVNKDVRRCRRTIRTVCFDLRLFCDSLPAVFPKTTFLRQVLSHEQPSERCKRPDQMQVDTSHAHASFILNNSGVLLVVESPRSVSSIADPPPSAMFTSTSSSLCADAHMTICLTGAVHRFLSHDSLRLQRLISMMIGGGSLHLTDPPPE